MFSDYPAHSFAGCRHWRQPVAVGTRQVTCSTFGFAPEKEPMPDFGVYLDKAWQDRVSPIWTAGSAIKSVAVRRAYPAIVVDWPDMAGRSPELLGQLVAICRSKMRQGLVIDIGCQAGHGRTGTLLACLIARVEHLRADTAIREVRRRYCKHAIEHQAQEKAITEYVKTMGIRRLKA
ncbi:MAG: hypothetical protein Q8P59_05785 [Dehalococcoidia bacterium]|nr:hypothetical protein [Dehalococcoidia bacterium]